MLSTVFFQYTFLSENFQAKFQRKKWVLKPNKSGGEPRKNVQLKKKRQITKCEIILILGSKKLCMQLVTRSAVSVYQPTVLRNKKNAETSVHF